MTAPATVRLASIGTANPACRISQKLAARLCRQHYGSRLRPRSLDMLEQVLQHPSIRERHVAVDGLSSLPGIKDEDPDDRIGRFTRWAVQLSADAAKKALAEADLRPADVTALVVNTCTGYLCPGISTYLIETLGLRNDVAAVDLVGSGCGGAIPNLQMGAALIGRQRAGVALCIAVEICSATFQMDDDPALIISNAIFGDGAAAAVLWDRPAGLRVAGIASQYLPSHREDVRYVYKRGQLHNRLSQQLPRIICGQVPPFIRGFLARYNLTEGDVGHWALHPGGDRMVCGLQQELRLSDTQIEPTRTVLREFGNMSSPTVLYITRRILRQLSGAAGNRLLLCAYGAGMSMHACLLEG
jgi:predicted naringenin-chalcone synthase